MDKYKEIDKRVIEIADYMRVNPTASSESIASLFSSKLHRSTRTIKTYISHAKKYNKTILELEESVRKENIIKSAEESIQKDILTKEEAEELLTKIARKQVISISGVIMMPSYAEQIKAISTLSKMRGWEQPIKVEDVTPIFEIKVLNVGIPIANSEAEVEEIYADVIEAKKSSSLDV